MVVCSVSPRLEKKKSRSFLILTIKKLFFILKDLKFPNPQSWKVRVQYMYTVNLYHIGR